MASQEPECTGRSNSCPLRPTSEKNMEEMEIPHTTSSGPTPAVLGPPPVPGLFRSAPKPLSAHPKSQVAQPIIVKDEILTEEVQEAQPAVLYVAEAPPIEVSSWYPLIDMLWRNEQIITSIVIEETGTSNLEVFAPAITHAFACKGKPLELVLPIIIEEIRKTESASTLFRGNCLATKILSAYCFSVGNEFLKRMLLGPVTYIADNPEKYEVNPVKLSEDEDLEENQNHLREAVRFFFANVLISLPFCPPIIHRICWELRNQVVSRFPSSNYTAIGGFIFLRFICPAIISPENFDVIDWKIPRHARRPLILISKVLQNIGNGVEFGNKEEYMIPLNDCINEKIPLVHEYFDMLASPEYHNCIPPSVTPDDALMEKLHSHVYLMQNKIFKKLGEHEEDLALRKCSLVNEFHASIEYLGIPKLLVQKHKEDLKILLKQLKKEAKQVEKYLRESEI